MSWRSGLRSGSDRFTPENRQAAIDLQESFRQASAARRAERNAAAAAAGASYSTGTTPAPSRPNTPPHGAAAGPGNDAIMAQAFEDINGVDDDKALSTALNLTKGFEWKPNNINF